MGSISTYNMNWNLCKFPLKGTYHNLHLLWFPIKGTQTNEDYWLFSTEEIPARKGWENNKTATISGGSAGVCAGHFGLTDHTCDVNRWGDTNVWLKLWLR